MKKENSNNQKAIFQKLNFVKRKISGIAIAGDPNSIYDKTIDFIDLPNIVDLPEDSFLLKVKGSSLKDAFIFDGDLIIVNPNIKPVNENFVVAVFNEIVLVKKIIYKENKIELHSENLEFKPIIIENENSNFRIIGVVIGMYRKMS